MADKSVRINLYMSQKNLDVLDKLAEDMCLTRSAAFAVVMHDYLKNEEAKNALQNTGDLISSLQAFQSLMTQYQESESKVASSSKKRASKGSKK